MADVGRPLEFTTEVVRKLEEAFALDATVTEACFYAGISRDTYYRHTKEDKELSDRFEALRSNPVMLARQSVVAGIKTDPDLALKYLERKNKAEFSLRSELTGAEGKPLIVVGEVADKHNLEAETSRS